MLRSRTLLVAGMVSALALGFGASAQDAAVELDWGLLQDHCVQCHNFEDWAGGVAFDTMQTDDVGAEAEIWEAAVRKLRGRLMPPPGELQPQPARRDAFIHALEARLDAAAAASPDAGYVELHRLNRTEYENAVDALFGLEIDAERLLPPDMKSGGFDNVAGVLGVTATFLDQYIAAAREVSLLAVGEANPILKNAVYPVHQYANHTLHVEGLPLGTRDGVAVEHYFPTSGDYIFTVPLGSKDGSLLRSYPMGWLEYRHTLVLSIDDVPVFEASVGGADDLRAVDQQQQSAVEAILARFAEIRLPIEAGSHRVSVAFLARTFAESDDLLFPQQPGEGLDDIPVVVRLEVLGPFEPTGVGDTPSRRAIFSCHADRGDQPRACAESIMTRLASQAYRRAATPEDVEILMGFYDGGYDAAGTADGAAFEAGVQRAIMAMLSSTKFLYRLEEVPEGAGPGDTFAISDLELASRMSFFLWSEGPDAELIALAEEGRLSDPAVRAAQLQRMLADHRAEALVSNFAAQWLDLERADTIEPDPRLFPEFDPDLRASFHTELELFIESVLLEDKSVTELLTADYTFLNDRLARHYGIPEVRGSSFRRVVLEDSARWGLLGKGGILLQTSYPNRTSPVLRGAWVLDVLTGTPPAAPPPGVETDLGAVQVGVDTRTIRVRLESHREDAACNQCHGVIDPIGLALENFDATGAWRERDRYAGEAIDASGQLAGGGGPVSSPDDLRQALAANPEQFVQTLVEKLMTYALGRRLEYADMPAVRAIVAETEDDGWTFAAIAAAVVESEPFRMKTIPAEAVESGALETPSSAQPG